MIAGFFWRAIPRLRSAAAPVLARLDTAVFEPIVHPPSPEPGSYMPQVIGRSAEDLNWQRLGLENFFQESVIADTWEKLGPAPEVDFDKL